VAIPKIACGLDQLDWEQVKSIIRYIFENSSVRIIAFNKDNLSEEDKIKVILDNHDILLTGHQGVERTYNRVKNSYSWTGMKQQIKYYIKSCPTCQISKILNRNVKAPMVITTTSSRPLEKIFMDIVGPLPKTNKNNAYIITLQDDLTKFSWAMQAENHEANTVAYYFLTQFVCRHGLPKSIVTDYRTEFLSQVFTELCRLSKIKKSSSPYHPQSNGSLERSHRTLGDYLRSFVSKDQSS
jgi:hypothetical protein